LFCSTVRWGCDDDDDGREPVEEEVKSQAASTAAAATARGGSRELVLVVRGNATAEDESNSTLSVRNRDTPWGVVGLVGDVNRNPSTVMTMRATPRNHRKVWRPICGYNWVAFVRVMCRCNAIAQRSD
jgi:hypothetical protein